jgi:integrase
MTRNRHHIHKVARADGSVVFRAVIDLGRDPVTGKRKQARVSAVDKKTLEAKIGEAIARHDSGRPVSDSAMSLAAFLEQWLTYSAGNVKGGTLRTWRSRCDAWIIPTLGHKRLRDVKPLDVERLLKSITDAGRSSSTANVVHATLRTALNQAVRWELIQRNPCSAVKPPRSTPPEMRVWDAKQAARVIDAARSDSQYGALWRLAITTGMRVGELLGLRWADVDGDRLTISVRQTLARGERGAPTLGTPKTPKSRRTIAITLADAEVLRSHRAHQAAIRLACPTWHQLDLVFCRDDGKPTHPNSLARAFAQLIEAAGVPRIRMHDMRHSAISLMLANGIPVKVVSERVGHASATMTMDRYAHVLPGMQESAAAKLAQVLDDAGGMAI